MTRDMWQLVGAVFLGNALFKAADDLGNAFIAWRRERFPVGYQHRREPRREPNPLWDSVVAEQEAEAARIAVAKTPTARGRDVAKLIVDRLQNNIALISVLAIGFLFGLYIDARDPGRNGDIAGHLGSATFWLAMAGLSYYFYRRATRKRS